MKCSPRRLPFGLMLLASIPLVSCGKAGEERVNEEGWKPLFDRQTLTGWEVTQFGGQGRVFVQQGRIMMRLGNDLTGITWTGEFPRIGYEVTLEAMRVSGHDFFCGMTFPVKDSYCSLILGGWGGSVVGLSSVDGLDASENETGRLMKFDGNRWYRVNLRVSAGRIEAWLDSNKIVDLPTEGRDLDVRPEVRLSRPFGIASWRTTAALRDIRVRELEPGE